MKISGVYGANLDFELEEKGDWKGSVIICPGGGYEYLSPRENQPVAEAFRKNGYFPFVLEYDVASPVLGNIPLKQAAWAVKTVRGIRPGDRVFLCGFSAGGHLAASLGVHWNDREVFGEADRECRPDGLILCYPVITAGEKAHRGSIRRLAGEGDAPYFSLENFVSRDTPPAFL